MYKYKPNEIIETSCVFLMCVSFVSLFVCLHNFFEITKETSLLICYELTNLEFHKMKIHMKWLGGLMELIHQQFATSPLPANHVHRYHVMIDDRYWRLNIHNELHARKSAHKQQPWCSGVSCFPLYITGGVLITTWLTHSFVTQRSEYVRK